MEAVLGVNTREEKLAEKCYILAKENGYDEKFARKMRYLGNHSSITRFGYMYIDTTYQTPEYKIYSLAELTTDYQGKTISVEQRLYEIKKAFGENSNQYKQACETAVAIGLINESPYEVDKYNALMELLK